jgi:mono/diheme cytochrome c family protein
MRRCLFTRGVLMSAAIGTAIWLLIPQPGRAQYPTATALAGAAQPAAPGHSHPPGQEHKDDHAHDEGAAHEHPPVPAEYQRAHIPAFVWTDQWMISRGEAIHLERCAICHGQTGDGKGPAAAGLPLKPADFRGAMVNEMRGNYWFWRVSEGGAVEPFASKNSVMPAWKEVLSVEDRWAVIAYHHTFSGHTGPHVTSEHPEMVADHHVGQSNMSGAPKVPASASAPTTPPTTQSSGSGHRH